DKGQRYDEDEFRSLIKELINSGWTVAQHGTEHIYKTDDPGLLGINPFSEYAGLPYEEQYDKLKRGLDKLKDAGLVPDLFMAPGHSFDLNTLKALRELGFKALTDGLYNNPYIREDILFVPCTLTSHSKLKGTDTICLHPNMMDEHDVAELDAFLSEHHDEAICYDYGKLYGMAKEYGPLISSAEATTLKTRQKRDKIANSPKLSNYLVYTNHPNKVIKMLKRVFLSPLLLTGKFDDVGKK
ncbi:MAG: DUF2334 domain-containing protein, partial [Lachnospiraceae bacterium]|nr:DUF2334 domain-containing protein [Lachnospiraceae bacterium]